MRPELVRQKLRSFRLRRDGLLQAIAAVEIQLGHIGDNDLDRYCLGMIHDEKELGPLEEHLLACPACVERAEATEGYLRAIRSAAAKLGEQTSD